MNCFACIMVCVGVSAEQFSLGSINQSINIAWEPDYKVSRLQLQGRLLYKPYGCTGRHPKMPGLGLYKG